MKKRQLMVPVLAALVFAFVLVALAIWFGRFTLAVKFVLSGGLVMLATAVLYNVWVEMRGRV